ncbi:hypothetical protein AVEN_233532-1 [Araneus ventricosus]|uniref:Endonuclease/exonuclease/phosphatase domain-containing protein n=1 Tax=Araneus ventricosus TaxID=182803 RepID=A0A4Y2NBF2_ARAVE|nr:hypothetical protein AVEN_233532-1 [Araneus ventricosus]
MGPLKQPPLSGHSSVSNFDTFYIIQRVSDTNENFSNVSPFLVEKAITGSVGTVSSTKLMRSGDLLVEVASRKQAQQILTFNFLSTIPVTIKPHDTLNTSKSVITLGRLLNLSNDEITHELRGQGVKDIAGIKAGYVRCAVRPYIPNPLRCLKCQRFGHSKTNCRGTLTCARCAVAGHESTGCTAVEKCVNCQGQHTSFSRSCPKWKVEKEIVATKFKNNISFPEARRIVKAQSAPAGGSYASVVEKSHSAYQTTHCPHCHHIVTMSNPIPSASKSADTVQMASTSSTQKKIIPLQPISETCETPLGSHTSSEFKIVTKKKPKKSSKTQSANRNKITPATASKFWAKSPTQASSSTSVTVHHKSDKNKFTSKMANLNSDSNEGTPSDTDSDLSVTSAPEVSNHQKNGARSQSEKSQKLKQAKRGLFCIGLQETFLSSHHSLKLRGYNSVRKDAATGSNHSGVVCILTSNLYPSTPLTLHTSLQAVAVQVHARTLVTVCSVYLPPHDVISQQDLDTLVDQLPTPFILLGDFNGHSTLWGSDDTNSRGRQIERFISNNCLCLLNNDEKTYFHEPTRTFHSLDLAICSPALMPLLNFSVGCDLHNSDHFPLIVSYADSGGGY